ncbi:hypothetical protein D5S18_09575 [Nocardia panacis]|uniref:TPR repeat domain-containing protein n=1 Tax=Nocardia panacis TaxID=2340916 RepID=A0A3A4KMI6_9NOCA|nr:hypothetical protein [Nocardia panacis]RJO76537.1 hypothetical protein D5S18_09575 [Nocardia panacis]
MSLTPDQIRSWRPHDLVEVAAEWNNLADNLDEVFKKYADALVRTGDGGYWEGNTAQTAQQTAQDDKKHVGTMTEDVRELAKLLNDNWYTIEAPLQRAKAALDGLAAHNCEPSGKQDVYFYSVLVESMMINGKTFAELPEATKQEIRQLAADLHHAAETAKTADDNLRQQLDAKAEALPAAFTSAAALGPDQARSDGRDLVNGTMSPYELQRLIDAGTLSPDQIRTLQAGDAVHVTASSMEYMTEVAHSLDGKSPKEIQQIMDKLPPEGRQALANSLQLVSNDRVDGGPAGKGGFDRLPAKVKDSLTRKDLVTEGIDYRSGNKSIKLNGVADNQAIAGIVAAGDDRYKQGSTLDNHLMDVGRQYLDAQVKHERNPNRDFEFFSADGYSPKDGRVTEPIFQAAGQDKFAVETAVVDKAHGKDFVTEVLTHTWSDHGAAASTLFKFNDGDADVTDPNNKVDVATATRTGHIMSKVAEYAATDDQWKKFADTGDHHSVGEKNPDLVRTVSRSMSPYIDSLVDEPKRELPGFRTHTDDNKSWIDPDGNRTYRGAERVFALMNTDKAASEQFTGAAMDRILQNENDYARDPHRRGAEGALATAGRINGLMDRGLQDGIQASNDAQHDIAKEAYDRKSHVYDALKSGVQFSATATSLVNPALTPFTEATKSIIDGGGDVFKSAIIGSAPSDADGAKLAPPNFSQRNYEVLARTAIPPEVQAHFYDLFDNGKLKPWDQLQGDGSNTRQNMSNDVDEMMNMVMNPQIFRNAYDDVTRTAARPK